MIVIVPLLHKTRVTRNSIFEKLFREAESKDHESQLTVTSLKMTLRRMREKKLRVLKRTHASRSIFTRNRNTPLFY